MFAYITGFYIMLVWFNELIREILSEDAVRVDDIIYNSGKAEAEDYY
jgi:hypothetical protein